MPLVHDLMRRRGCRMAEPPGPVRVVRCQRASTPGGDEGMTGIRVIAQTEN